MAHKYKIRLMQRLAHEIKLCKKCPGMNIKGVTENAPGYGNVDSRVMLVGQSLCHRCMKSQVPFTGGSGVLLDEVLEKLRIHKSELFITNVVHCHPIGNRPSRFLEISNCRQFLEKEIKIVQPRLIVALGKDATQWFLGKVELSDVVYHLISWDNIFVYPAYHPSFIMKKGKHARKDFVSRLAEVVSQWM